MKNEYGQKLDKNGYAPSLLQHYQDACFLCGKGGDLARHEIFPNSNRSKSKALGLWVCLCPGCHYTVHHDAEAMASLRRRGQRYAEEELEMSRETFIQRFGKSYLAYGE